MKYYRYTYKFRTDDNEYKWQYRTGNVEARNFIDATVKVDRLSIDNSVEEKIADSLSGKLDVEVVRIFLLRCKPDEENENA